MRTIQSSLLTQAVAELFIECSYVIGDDVRAAIDEAISRQEQLIERLGEYRKSVIHHAVTGKIDCTEA